MAIRIAVCDDEEEQLQSLSGLLSKWAGHSGLSLDMRTFPSAEAFLFAYEEDSAYDILILDIEMKDISGMELARRIRKEDKRVEILFLNSHFEFISEGYEVDALHYLTKPVAEEKLYAVLTKALDRLSTEPPSLIINCQGETIKLYETDILYVESFLHYISIHTVPHASGRAFSYESPGIYSASHGSPVHEGSKKIPRTSGSTLMHQGSGIPQASGNSTVRQGPGIPPKTVPTERLPANPRPQEYRIKESISAFEKKLSADFFRIHRSYLVSLKHITRISRTSVTLDVRMEEGHSMEMGHSMEKRHSMEERHSIELPLARGKYDEINEAFIRRN